MSSAELAKSIGQELPFLRRYARALTGSQTAGDNYAAATLEAILADRSLLDEIVQMDGELAIQTARQLMAQGLMVGISTGSNVRAALDLAARPEMQGKNIVTFACDTAERYMSTRLFLDT